MDERLVIDKALVLSRPPLADARAVYEHFDLARRYGIGWESFEEYARRTRKVHAIGYADRLMSEVLSELSDSKREGPLDLMTFRLARRIVRLLAREEVNASELAKLSASAASLRRAAVQAETDRLRRELLRAKLAEAMREEDDGRPDRRWSERIRQAIQEVYGVQMNESDGRVGSPHEGSS